MSSVSDESPVTYGQLRHELGELEVRFDHKLDRLEQKLEQKLVDVVRKQDLDIWAGALEARLSTAIERSVRIVVEQHRRESTILDEKYQDLPARVSRLEAEVFPPKRSRRR